MITVLFDTNILHQEGLFSSRIQRFQRLLKSSECRLIIPEIVLEEYRSKRIAIARHEFAAIIQSCENLKRNNFFDKEWGFTTYLDNILKECIENISNVIDSWVEKNDVDVYKISNTCIDKLFKNYFAGAGAFREPKCREDIPDAVIYDAIENIS